METCPKCGNTLNNNQKFCTKCGTKIEEKKKDKLYPEIHAKIDILQKKISNDNLNNLLYIQLGDIYYEHEMYKEAILEYQKAFSIDNTSLDSICKTADTYRKINNNSKAEQLYKKALTIDPKSQIARIGLFWSLANLEKNDELIKIEKDISNEFKDINFHIALKDAYKKTENFSKAFQEMEIIYKLKSGEPDNLRDLAAHYYISDHDKSIEYFQQIFAIFPDDLETRYELGKYYCTKNDYKKSINLLGETISSFQSDQVEIAKYYLANSYLHINEFDKAKEEISFLDFSHLKEASLKDKRIISGTYFMLCTHSQSLKRYSLALKYIQNAIEFEPDNEIFIKKEIEITEIWNSESKKSRVKSAKKIKISLAIVFSIILISIVSIKLVNIKKDNSAWKSTESEKTIKSYYKYLSNFPNGIHAIEADSLLEKAIWEKSDNENNTVSYEIYLNDYPEGKYSMKAKSKIEQIAWEKAMSINTKKSYDNYIQDFSSGIHLADANNKLLDIEQKLWDSLIQDRFSFSSYTRYTSIYPNGLFKEKADSLLLEENFVYVKGGTFMMGSNNGDADEKPIHSVTVSDFYICKYEVTQELYETVMGVNPSHCRDAGSNAPVEEVSWYDAVKFCNKKSIQEGLTPCYSGSTCNFNANGYRLPTEAEWEYAAR